jgi:hypothetical protein
MPSPTNRNRWIDMLRPGMPSESTFVMKNAAESYSPAPLDSSDGRDPFTVSANRDRNRVSSWNRPPSEPLTTSPWLSESMNVDPLRIWTQLISGLSPPSGTRAPPPVRGVGRARISRRWPPGGNPYACPCRCTNPPRTTPASP